MKKSRLSLFRLTSTSLAIVGLVMIIATVIVFGYIGVDKISSSVSSGVDNGAAYDELALLNSEYQSLSADYTDLKANIHEKDDDAQMKAYINADMELVKAKSAIEDVESALSSDKSTDEINERLKKAKEQLKTAKQKYSDVLNGKYDKSGKISNKLDDETQYTTA